MGRRRDLIVIGGGPAGAAAGITAARAGLDVLLIDKATFPREKLCGGGFTGRSRRHMGEIFGRDVTPDLFLPCNRFRLTAGARTVAELADAPTIWLTMRRAFDAMLLSAAEDAGCGMATGQRIASFDPKLGQVVLASGEEVSAPVIIGADGATSMVARRLFGRAYDPARVGFGMEVELPRDGASDADAVEIDLSAAEWGYGWSFPKPGSITVGVGGIHRRNPTMPATLDRFLGGRDQDAARLRPRGAFLPFGEVRPVPGMGTTLLAGDAAGLVDPITGEGIAWAMKSGQLAAGAAAEALAGRGPEMALPRYRRAIAPICAELRRARALRWLFYQPMLQPAFLRLLAGEPRLQRRYLALLSGEADYADLGWRALPRLAARMAGRSFLTGA
ncbi:geranylgeranyl reductase family protein [Tabrizicola sp. J26]|uniref:NAD(P)/FAD-dependent oxidoreductase n=1 Tax=Alitabrizicola rongguiensis TaxID=2909234 RepID=UPI001F277490|nr:geranylgeranyl reductase family protein [Tabrizicola rongguiensis]MCF1707324.1 geranylgeranyl reductase family protein [Tabrizicola rongguiensis]